MIHNPFVRSILLGGWLKIFFPTKIVCGKQVWLPVHVGSATIAFLLTIAAYVVIFVDKNGKWSTSAGAHAYFGTLVLATCVINVGMGALRQISDKSCE